MKSLKSLIALVLVTVSFIVIAGQPSAHTVFDHLKNLQGDWHSTSGKTIANFKVIANGSSIAETWTMSPTRQSMTVYTMDGDRLIATHYCPQGNAPRLELSSSDTDGTHHFEFLDGANLQDTDSYHEHAFWIKLESPDTLVRNETYIANGSVYDPKKDLGSKESFTRSK